MRIRFEIKEKLSEIIDEIMHSEKWNTSIEEELNDQKRVIIKDPHYNSEAIIDIWKQEIHITTAWSHFNYRIFKEASSVWCEYIGAYRGLLEQQLLPKITPKYNILDSEVTGSSIVGNKNITLREYSNDNLKLKNFRRDNFSIESELTSDNDHPKIVYDNYIKEGMPMPSPEPNKKK
jgi:hypothetical protein